MYTSPNAYTCILCSPHLLRLCVGWKCAPGLWAEKSGRKSDHIPYFVQSAIDSGGVMGLENIFRLSDNYTHPSTADGGRNFNGYCGRVTHNNSNREKLEALW
ncbi:predicted protein [Histoplasma capsulatum G186AR]|uniref:Uncharacterized protein n=1 Tax=Ajellomyces capsulatus (strain G186AR / H82 / ATCC MYA-2454 / RMSCC 2432) TaxID=447093 RepID=C0P0E4_AJECG|nr:uncharacterized protein HCBG_08863 [Histoplasma capsulatum G186AR]EEH02960.1 predicted protein [Histoplasma capsulatum G186AR]